MYIDLNEFDFGDFGDGFGFGFGPGNGSGDGFGLGHDEDFLVDTTDFKPLKYLKYKV